MRKEKILEQIVQYRTTCAIDRCPPATLTLVPGIDMFHFAQFVAAIVLRSREQAANTEATCIRLQY